MLLLISLWSCDPSEKYEKEENAKIKTFLSSNSSINFVLKPSGLYYYDVQVGTGRTPVMGDTAYVEYTVKSTDGTIIGTNVGTSDTLIFPVAEGYMIAGFDEGITYMKAGGKAMFLIPSKLAYGPVGYLTIPGYTPLVYDVYLVHVKSGSGK